MIKITFPDGAVKEFESGTTTLAIAESISKSLAKKALAGKVNGKLVDLTRPIEEDASIEIITPDHEDALGLVRHSAAHLMAQPCVASSKYPLWRWTSYRFRVLLRYR